MAIIDELVAMLGYDIEGEANLRKFNKSMDDLEKKAENVGKAIGTMARVAGTAVAAGFTFLGASVINTSAKFETYLATLETIEGSSIKAQAAMDWVKEFAKTTPHEVDELTAAFVKLRFYGLDPMDGSMIVLGDTAAGMGKSINQVVEAMADASTFQFERLRELGIVASQSGDQVTFSWTENGVAMSRTLKKTSTEVTNFLTEVWGKKFGGAMIRQSKTWTGMLSNLGDSWTDFQLKIGDAGFFDTVKRKLGDLMDTVAQWQSDGTIERIAGALSGMFTGVANAIGFLAERIGTHVTFISEHFEELKPYINAVGGAFLWMLAKAFPMIVIFTLAGIALDDFLTFLEGGESIIGNFIEWLRTIIPVSDEVATALAGLALAVGTGLAAAFILNPMTSLGIVVRLVAGLAGLLAPALLGALTGLSATVAAGFTAAFALLSNPIGWAIILAGVAAALIAFFWDDLIGLWNAVDWASLGKTIGDGILAGLQGVAGAIKSLVASWMTPADTDGLAAALAQANGEIYNSPQNPFGGPRRPPGDPGLPPGSPAGEAGARFGASVIKPSDVTNNQTVNVNAPVTVQVQQASQAPGAVGDAVAGAVKTGAQPPRMNGGMN